MLVEVEKMDFPEIAWSERVLLWPFELTVLGHIFFTISYCLTRKCGNGVGTVWEPYRGRMS